MRLVFTLQNQTSKNVNAFPLEKDLCCFHRFHKCQNFFFFSDFFCWKHIKTFSILTLSYLRLDGFHGDLLVSHLLSLLELLLQLFLLLFSSLLASQMSARVSSSFRRLFSFLESCFSIVSSLLALPLMPLRQFRDFRLKPLLSLSILELF